MLVTTYKITCHNAENHNHYFFLTFNMSKSLLVTSAVVNHTLNTNKNSVLLLLLLLFLL
jgi:hypothetical protein